MHRKTWLILAIVGSIALTGCSSSELESLRKENAALKQELDDLRYGAQRLYEQAKASADTKNYVKAKETLSTLLAKYPTGADAEKAKQLVAAIDESIEEEAKEREDRLAKATSLMHKEYDEVRETTWYYDSELWNSGGWQYADLRDSLYLYIGSKQGQLPWLRMVIWYSSDEWLFIDKYTVKADEQSFEFAPEYSEVKRENASGEVWEWYDITVDKHAYEVVKAILSADKTIVRHEGDTRYSDRTLTSVEKRALQRVLDAYEALGGKTDF